MTKIKIDFMDIKFKAIRQDGKGWIFGDYIKGFNLNVNYPCIEFIEDGTFSKSEYVKPETVCQFTGFITKKSKQEVYRGDRVLVKGSTRRGIYETEVIWDRFGFTLKENSTKLIDSACLICIIEVIGNIYDEKND